MLGYLIAGIAIGPWGLASFETSMRSCTSPSWGVVFLMFIIGLSWNLRKLWELRRSIFGAGAGQGVDHRCGAGRVAVSGRTSPGRRR